MRGSRFLFGLLGWFFVVGSSMNVESARAAKQRYEGSVHFHAMGDVLSTPQRALGGRFRWNWLEATLRIQPSFSLFAAPHLSLAPESSFQPIGSVGLGFFGGFAVVPAVGFRWLPIGKSSGTGFGIRLDGEFPYLFGKGLMEFVVFGVTYVF